MLLASLSGAMTAYGLDSGDTDLVEGTTLALEAATQRLAGELRTGFDRACVTDIFWVDEFRVIRPNMRGHLKLSRGFVDRTQPITIVGAHEWNDLVGVSPMFQWVGADVDLGSTLDLSAYVGWEYEKGRVDLDGRRLKIWPWIKVIYTAGFTSDPSLADTYNQSQVPTWLQNLCMLGAHNILNDALPIKETQLKAPVGSMFGGYTAAVARRARYMPGATLPQSSDEIDLLGKIILLTSSEVTVSINETGGALQPNKSVPVPTGGFSQLQLIAGGSATGGAPTGLQLQPMVSTDAVTWTALGSVLTAAGTYSISVPSGYFGVALQQISTGSVTVVVQ